MLQKCWADPGRRPSRHPPFASPCRKEGHRW
jgi:hypothetical protein